MICSVFIAASLDGFIARKDGSIDWLLGYNDESGEQYGFKNFLSSIDYIIMGRNTFELISSFQEWPYGDKKVIVLSSKYPREFVEINKKAQGTSLSASEVLSELKKKGANKFYIDGGKCIQSFISEGLISKIIITKIPVLLGSGIPLFGSLTKDIKLKHIETKTFPDGLVQTTYELE